MKNTVMKKLSRLFAFLLTVICLFSVSACNSGETPEMNPEQELEQETEQETGKTPVEETVLAEMIDKKDIEKVQTEQTFTISTSQADYGRIYPSFNVSDDMLLQRRKYGCLSTASPLNAKS